MNGEEQGTFDRGAFLTNPTDCSEGPAAREASVAMNTWEDPDPSLPFTASAPAFSAIEGCNLLNFSADLGVKPETTQADEPSGYNLDLDVPQAPNDGSGLGTPPFKEVDFTFPVYGERGACVSGGGCDEVVEIDCGQTTAYD